ncbi:MAG: hypothetical protein E7330_00370 [Clostridiales bacterium]|nr:hypothetical protein [Clostridiales bacterium]
MYGAIIGDIVGSRYEFFNIKTKDFPLFSPGCDYTDDSIMTVAAAKALLRAHNEEAPDLFRIFTEEMRALGQAYPDPMGAYGSRFIGWLFADDPTPYFSCGNGSAMRVSPCALYAKTLEEALFLAEASANITHNHPEGIKGAKATAAAIFLAKTGSSKAEIAQYIRDRFYPLEKSLDEIRPAYSFDGTCQGTVPEALTAFLESTSFEDAIRNAISLGGDSDTIGAITGSVAYAYYRRAGEDLFAYRKKAEEYLPEEFIEVIAEFERVCGSR